MSTIQFGYSPPNPPTKAIAARLEQLVARNEVPEEKLPAITFAVKALAEGMVHQSHIFTLFCFFRDRNTPDDTKVAQTIHEYVFPVVVTNMFDQLAMAANERKTIPKSAFIGKVDRFIRTHQVMRHGALYGVLKSRENLELFEEAIGHVENVLMPALLVLGRGRKEIFTATLTAARDYLAFARGNG